MSRLQQLLQDYILGPYYVAQQEIRVATLQAKVAKLEGEVERLRMRWAVSEVQRGLERQGYAIISTGEISNKRIHPGLFGDPSIAVWGWFTAYRREPDVDRFDIELFVYNQVANRGAAPPEDVFTKAGGYLRATYHDGSDSIYIEDLQPSPLRQGRGSILIGAVKALAETLDVAAVTGSLAPKDDYPMKDDRGHSILDQKGRPVQHFDVLKSFYGDKHKFDVHINDEEIGQRSGSIKWLRL